MAIADPAAAAELILSRCTGQNGWQREAAGEIARLMAEADPQSEVVLNATCAACGAQFQTMLDAASYLFEEVAARTASLFREVHLLAFYYHWSEADILRLAPGRRRTYLGLIDSHVGSAAIQ